MHEPLNDEQKKKLEELARTPVHITVPAGVLNLLLQYLSFCAECNPAVVPKTDADGRRESTREQLYYGNLRDLVHLIDRWYEEMQRQLNAAGGDIEALRTSPDRIQ